MKTAQSVALPSSTSIVRLILKVAVPCLVVGIGAGFLASRMAESRAAASALDARSSGR